VIFAACATRSTIIVPPEAVREWAWTPDGHTASGRYVVRMTDGKREWEVEFPDAASGTEVRVPLRNGGRQVQYSSEHEGLTAADREIESERQARERAQEKEDPIYHMVDQPPPSQKKAKTQAKKQSYLMGVAQVREFYDSRNYEVALVHLVDLEKEYPNDEKLLAMKGSIYKKLGKLKLAREAWERVLVLNPDNQVVASALRALVEGDERPTKNRKEDADDE
jgi:tetratricopeptide (TPR) repeat protein